MSEQKKYKYRYTAVQDMEIAGVTMKTGDTGFLETEEPINRVGFECVDDKRIQKNKEGNTEGKEQ